MYYKIENKLLGKVLSIKISDFVVLFVNFLFGEENILYIFLLENLDKDEINLLFEKLNNIGLVDILNVDGESNINNEINIKNIFHNFCLSVFEQIILINPKFDRVYSKILMLLRYYEISKSRNKKILNPYINLKKHIDKGIKNKIYVKNLYNMIELIDIPCIIIDRDFLLNSNAIKMFFNRYSYINKNINFYELPQEVFFLISMMLSESLFNKKQKFISFVVRVYNQISLRKISPSTPFLLNLRTNKNTASCFIMSMGDSLEDICHTSVSAAKIAKNGGGVGIDFSNVRCRKSFIQNIIGKASGVIPYIKVCNDLMIAFDQLGKRDGALTTALSIWHYDMISFLNLQTEENFDYRFKAFDIFPQIIMHDLFMQYVKDDKTWILVDPYEINVNYKINLVNLCGEKFSKLYEIIINDILNRNNPKNITLYKKIKARKLFDIIIETQIHTGLPYIFFKDTVNKLNPNKDSGIIYCGNLCQESFSNFSKTSFNKTQLIKNKNKSLIYNSFNSGKAHTCNLLSINLSKFINNNKIDYDSLKETAMISVIILDNLIDSAIKHINTPIMESYIHNKLYRTIGIGVMGLHDLFAALNIYYASLESIELVDKLFEFISYYVLLSSCNLSKYRGSYPMFKYSEWKKGIIFNKNIKWFKDNETLLGYDKWFNLIQKIKKYGIRNGQLLAIAPNSSTSIMNGVANSVLPVYNTFFLDKNQYGSLLIFPFFNKKIKFYISNKEIDNFSIVKLISRIYKWIDQGISMELLIDINQKDVRLKYVRLIFEIWRLKIKTIYYIRTIQYVDKEQQKMISLLNNDIRVNKKKQTNCELCSN